MQDVRESGQVIGGLAIAFLLLSGLIGFIYFLVCLLYAIRGRKQAAGPTTAATVPPGLHIAGIIFG